MSKINSMARVIAIIMACCAVFTFVPAASVGVNAAEAAAYGVSDVTASAGETVEVYFSVENNPGIISLRCKFEYDTDVLELVKVENLGLFAGFTTPSAILSSPYTLRWADALANENNESCGNFAKAVFKVKDGVAEGEYKISISHVEARTVEGNKLSFAAAEGVVTVCDKVVTEPVKGDLDGDGVLSPKDINIAKKLLAGAMIPTDTQKAAGDVNGDGAFNGLDGNMLSKYVAGIN
ncbi:MAG: hypothetical protein IJF69_00800 [Clostridia bacterium]|nr:hypothetical protein [Clostridia bacterium]